MEKPPLTTEGSRTSEKLYLSSRDYFTALLKHCQSAEASLEVEVYIFDDDRAGRELLCALEESVERGVHVRILVDGIGSPHWINEMVEKLPHRGIETRVFHPVPHPFFRFWWHLFPRFWRMWHFFLLANSRNHKKVYIFDGKTAFVGGINISEESLEWQDAGVCLQGPEASLLVEAFNENWQRAFYFGKPWSLRRKKSLPRLQSSRLFLNHNLKLRRETMKELLDHFDHAKKRIWISNPYWAPGPGLLRALIRAARRGVDVRLCIPEKPDVRFTRWVNEILLGPLLPFGVQLYEYQRGFLHAKTLLVDDWTRVGSSNFNTRSFYHDLEVDVVLERPENRIKLAQWFEGLCQRAKKVCLEDIHQRPLLERWAGRFMLLFKRWI